MTKTLVIITAFLALGVLLAAGSPIKHPILALQLALAEPPASLPVPVDGVRPSAIRNSWRAPRDGGRHHQGVDIFAKPGTPVRSTTEGIIIRLGQNRLGGNVVWVMGPGRQTHYYAHLSDFGAFEIGDRVMAVISLVMSVTPAMPEERRIIYTMVSTNSVEPRSIRTVCLQQSQSRASLAATANVPILFGMSLVSADADELTSAKRRRSIYVMRLLTLRYHVIKDYALC